MKVLVTGGAGFIGYHLTKKLIELGHDVTVLDNLSTGKNIPVCPIIIGDIQSVNLYQFYDQIYNLACPASPKHYQKDPLKTLSTCYNGTLNMLTHGQYFLQASTSEVYGDPTQHPQTEDYQGNVNPTGPRSCYDEGKRIAETICYLHNASIVRIFNTYGPYMAYDDGRVIPNLITQALNNKPLTIYGNGQQTRSLCYIDDMVEGLIKAMAAQRKHPINLGNPEEVTILQLANKIIELTNSKSEIVFKPLPKDDPKQRCPDITKAKQVLHWHPTISLDEGLKRTINYFCRI